ncbi:PREDICTED: uncharacterized protein LOC104598027 [Nelumbo nucifera]|uniref:Protein WAVE n=2 Tax=Nelumbo nucifera TaxID=4432 RepID=A0A822YGW2_NELNU|nr:PREDICTED: uncharacterized protein LOC104598027 [Nelumbo nucifera]DAD31373.1 TPA_asm: hypothetical protein HUJ06_010224 [Nelumbo nucifera]
MGTKVQCKSYLPGYYSMRDLNEDANSGSWPLYYEDKNLRSGQHYNSFLPRPTTDGYLGYDKEVLKQTMLMHESIFRKQVHELHRLYRIQRDLMDELKMKTLHKYILPAETTQSCLFSSQMSSEDSQKMWHISSLPLVNSACSRASVSGTDKMQPPFSFCKDNNMQVDLAPTQNGDSSKDCKLLESKSKKFPRKVFDLQLPADEYIDSEGETLEEEKVSEISVVANYTQRNSGIAPDRDVNLSLGSSRNHSSQGESSRSESSLRSKHHGLADLNEPIQVEEVTDSAPVDFLHPVNCHKEIKGQNLPTVPNSGLKGSPRDFFKDTQKGRSNETSSNIQNQENEGRKREWLSYNLEAGQSNSNLKPLPQGVHSENLLASSAPIQVELKKAHEFPRFLISDHDKKEPWREKAICSLGISDKDQNLPNFNNPYPVVSQSDMANFGVPSASSWRRPMCSLSQKNPIAVEALPCVNPFAPLSNNSKSSLEGSGVIEDKWHLNGNLRLNPNFGSEISHKRNGFCHGSQLESKPLQVCSPSVGFDYLNCSNEKALTSENFEDHGSVKRYKGSDFVDVKTAKDRNLNMVLPSGFNDTVVPQRDLVIIDGERKHEDPSAVLPWLRGKPACNDMTPKARGNSERMGLDFLQVNHQHFSDKVEAGNGPSLHYVHDTEPKSVKVADRLGDKKILGVPIFEKPCASNNHSSFQLSPARINHYPSRVEDVENNGKATVLHIDLSCDPILPNLGDHFATQNLMVEKGSNNTLAASRNHINLNSCADEDDSSSVVYFQSEAKKNTTGIDLEVPAVPETEEGIPTGDEFLENQLEKPVQSSEHEDGDPHGELIRTAAEVLVAISSSSVNKHLENDNCHPSGTSMMETLHWFADIVSSNMDDLQNEVDLALRSKDRSNQESSSSDESDYFETMTLQLTELKVEERWCKPPEILKVEETGSATSLLSRPRKGQGRRGRQRRDFQRDILPGLASLSRHEVTEDLQTIGGLMKATGCPWETGLAKRNAGRGGWPRGRRRSRGPTPTMAASIPCSPPEQQPSNSELGLEDRSLTGWGKTTRRPRRQRCPAGNLPPLPVALV